MWGLSGNRIVSARQHYVLPQTSPSIPLSGYLFAHTPERVGTHIACRKECKKEPRGQSVNGLARLPFGS